MSGERVPLDASEIGGSALDIPWNEAERDAFYEKLLANYGEEPDEPDDEPRCPFDEDKLAYWGSLDLEGWELEEMLSQGMIDIATYLFEDEPQEPAASVPAPPICVREYIPEEFDQFEIISF